jgi:hypothetical protein
MALPAVKKEDSVCSMKCLQRLSLQSNRLTTLEGIEVCTQLRELYLSHNGIADAKACSVQVGLPHGQLNIFGGVLSSRFHQHNALEAPECG